MDVRILKREDKRQMTSQYGHGFLSIFFDGKYDLIKLHRQIIHQSARNFFFTTKKTSPTWNLTQPLPAPDNFFWGTKPRTISFSKVLTRHWQNLSRIHRADPELWPKTCRAIIFFHFDKIVASTPRLRTILLVRNLTRIIPSLQAILRPKPRD